MSHFLSVYFFSIYAEILSAMPQADCTDDLERYIVSPVQVRLTSRPVLPPDGPVPITPLAQRFSLLAQTCFSV